MAPTDFYGVRATARSKVYLEGYSSLSQFDSTQRNVVSTALQGASEYFISKPVIKSWSSSSRRLRRDLLNFVIEVTYQASVESRDFFSEDSFNTALQAELLSTYNTTFDADLLSAASTLGTQTNATLDYSVTKSALSDTSILNITITTPAPTPMPTKSSSSNNTNSLGAASIVLIVFACVAGVFVAYLAGRKYLVDKQPPKRSSAVESSWDQAQQKPKHGSTPSTASAKNQSSPNDIELVVMAAEERRRAREQELRRFVSGIGLSVFAQALIDFGIESLEDLNDSDIISRDELSDDIGMSDSDIDTLETALARAFDQENPGDVDVVVNIDQMVADPSTLEDLEVIVDTSRLQEEEMMTEVYDEAPSEDDEEAPPPENDTQGTENMSDEKEPEESQDAEV